MTKPWKFAVVAALVAAFGALAVAGLGLPAEEAVPRAYQCEVYTEQGCSKYVVASGGELEIQSGGTLDIQSGSAMTVAAAMDMTGTLNVDGAVTFNSTLDVDGNISSGTGGISVTDSISVSGAANFDSGATFNSTVDILGNLSSSTGGISVTDTISVSGAANFDAAAVFNSTVDIVGNLSSSTGGISVTDTISVGQAANFDSTIAVGDDITFVNGTTLGEATDTVLDFSEFLAATEQTAISVTVQAYITPTGTYQPLTSAAAVSTSLVTSIMSGTLSGQMLILVNENASDTITIVDGANVHCGADIVLGTTDTMFLMWDGIDWLCLGQRDN